jgi:broad specificity phosphatase PhoE
MKLYLIRHGQTTGDIENRFGGSYDDNLTNLGRKQANQLGEKLKSRNINVIFHSPLLRAKQTAQIVSKITSISIEEKIDLRERNFWGKLSGMKKNQAKKDFPDEFDKLKDKGINHNITDSENYSIFKKRIIGMFNEILKLNFDSVGIIFHGGPIICLMKELGFGDVINISDCGFIEMDYDKELKIIYLDGVKFSERS